VLEKSGSKPDILSRMSASLTGGQIRSPRALEKVAQVSVVIPCYNYGRFPGRRRSSLSPRSRPRHEQDNVQVGLQKRPAHRPQRWRRPRLAEGALLYKIARKTMARQALEHINYAYAGGFRDSPTEDFETFAKEVDPMVEQTRLGRRVARRKRLGMVSLTLHPLWALAAVHWRQYRRVITGTENSLVKFEPASTKARAR
jgi:hypothetical protein